MSEFTKDKVAELFNVFLPEKDYEAQVQARKRPAATSMDDVNRVLFYSVLHFNPHTLALVREYHGKDNKTKREKKKYLYFKLIGEYNIAVEIIRRWLPLDMRIFYSVFSDDEQRCKLFKSLEEKPLDTESVESYITEDRPRLRELVETYDLRIREAKDAGLEIIDLRPYL